MTQPFHCGDSHENAGQQDMSRATGFWRPVKILFITVLATVFAFLVALECFLAWKKHQYFKNPSTKGDIVLNKILLYGDPDHRMHADRHNDLNSDNIRSIHTPESIHKEDLNIIFLGDSFTYGFLLPTQSSIPSQFEVMARAAHPGMKINAINFAWVSSSPLLDYRLLKEIGRKYQPDIVVLNLDIGDFGDDIFYTRLFEHRDIFLFSSILPGTTALLEAFSNLLSSDDYEKLFGYPKSVMFANELPLGRSLPYIEAYSQRIIDDIAHYTTQELGAKFILVMNPRSFQYNDKEALQDWNRSMNRRTENSYEVFRYMDQLQQTRDYPVFSLLPGLQQTTVFPTTFGTDSHWNVAGCNVVAELLMEKFESLGLFQ